MTPGHAEYLRNKVRPYGITVFEYLFMRENQQSACLICGIHDTNLVIDHCHSTGKVRGLLCGRCNKGLGWMNDDVRILSAAIDYLNEAR